VAAFFNLLNEPRRWRGELIPPSALKLWNRILAQLTRRELITGYFFVPFLTKLLTVGEMTAPFAFQYS